MSEPYTGLAKYFEIMMGTKNVENECNQLHDIFNIYLDNPDRILDLGCGTGLHSLRLIEMGYTVTGIDISKDMIDVAKSKDEHQLVDFINTDIISFKTRKKYDAVISMWNVIGYVSNIEDTFDTIYYKLKKDGLFIFECFNGIAVAKHGASRTIKGRAVNEDGDWIVRSGIPELNLMKQTFNMKYHHVLKNKNEEILDEFDEEHKMNIYFPNEMKQYLKDTGFELIGITNVIDGELATEDDWDIRYIARKV